MKGRALLFGLNYTATPDASLQGCVQDVVNLSEYLQSTLAVPIKVCHDGPGGTLADTTRMGIVQNIYDLALQSYQESLDFVWIHYSGHGSYVRDSSSDERDGRDECLVPSDFKTAGLIADDFLNRVFRNFNPSTRVVFVCDACHSGTMCDVKYRWESPTRCTVENIACTVPAKVLTLSGCLDSQTSADAFNVLGDGKYAGALTSCLLIVLKETPGVRADAFKLLTAVRAKLRERGFPQIPALCSTYNMTRDFAFMP